MGIEWSIDKGPDIDSEGAAEVKNLTAEDFLEGIEIQLKIMNLYFSDITGNTFTEEDV